MLVYFRTILGSELYSHTIGKPSLVSVHGPGSQMFRMQENLEHIKWSIYFLIHCSSLNVAKLQLGFKFGSFLVRTFLTFSDLCW